jgi:membrane peptidoglycan carboxypeptidase
VAIEKMVDQDGSDVQIPVTTCKQGIEPDIAAAAAYALQSVITDGTAVASNPYDGIEHFAKTGTSDGNRQTWTTGASSKLGLSVWVGNVTGDADLRETYLDSGTAATARHRIWRPTMAALDAKYGGDDFPVPDNKFLRGIYVDVPDVTGQTLDGARQILEAAGFGFADGGTVKSSAPVGQVVGSDPSPGSSVSRGSTVTVYTSDGTPAPTAPPKEDGVEIPDVVGQSAGDATGTLQSAGFSDISYAWAEDPGNAGVCTVTGTDPGAGTSAPADTAITVFVAGAPAGNNGNGKGNGNGNGAVDPSACF